MTGSSSPHQPGPARTGPWAFRCCVTAACTRCGTVPLDEDTGLTPHFGSVSQACAELPRDWGWHLTPQASLADDELLCPPCAAAGNGTRRPGADPHGQETGQQPGPGMPANARVIPAARNPPQEENESNGRSRLPPEKQVDET